MKYKILLTMDFSAYFGDTKRWLQHMTLHYVEVPFVRQHDDEWKYLPNWHARRDRNYMSAEKAPESWEQPWKIILLSLSKTAGKIL